MSSRPFKQGGALALVTMGVILVGSMAYGVKEEVPVGVLGGRVLMEENGKPLPGADVVFTPQFELPHDAKIARSTETDENGRFAVPGMPAGLYHVSVFGRVHNNYGDSIYVPEGGYSDKEISTELSSRGLDLSLSDRVFLPDEEFTATVSGSTEDESLDLEIYRVDPKALALGDSLYTYTRALMAQKGPKNTAQGGPKPLKTIKHPLGSRDVEGYFTETLKLEPMPEGMYILRAQTKNKEERLAYFTVSKIALVTKTVDRKGLAYVVDLKSGRPIKGAQVSFHSPAGNRPAGATDAKGMASFAIPDGGGEASASATYGSSKAFTWFYTYQSDGANGQIWMQTDRPVYRPGDQVQFRGVIRTADEGRLATPTNGDVTVKVYDPDEILISTQQITLTKFGTFSGEFASDAIAPPGGYRIEAEYGKAKDSRTVQVLTYRKPEFSISVTPERKAYRRSESITWKVKVEYFTGEPLAGAEVGASLSRGAKWWGSPFDEGFDSEEYGDFSYYDEFIGRHTGVTNASGEATIVTPSGTFESEYADYSDYEYQLSVEVQDQSGRGFNGEGKVLVTRGSVDIITQFDSWIADPGQMQTATVEVKAYETGEGLANAKVFYQYVRQRWTEGDMVEVPASSGEVTTDAEGRATIQVNPEKEGSYTLKVWIREGDKKVATETWQWVGGSGESGPSPDMQIVLDKLKYGANDKAKALLRTSDPGGYALVSIEGESIKRVQVVELKTEATTVTLSNLAEFAPGAEVTVAYVKDKKFMAAAQTLRVEYSAQKVLVDVKPDREEAKPGENVTYTIHATDSQGRPVQAEVAIGVVDEGVYQILEDSNDPLRAFYSFDWNQVATNFSFPTLYLDSEDKAEPNMQIRKVFKDTAFWSPGIVTNAQGQAQVTVKMPDNLTSWRATATAVTADSRFGKSKSSLIVKKDLMARLSAPPFMVQGDTQEVGGLVTNTTDKEQTVEVRLIGVGLQVEGQPSKKLTVPARSAVAATWTLAAANPAPAKLQFTASAASGLNDGLEQNFTVKPFGRRTVTGQTGAKTGGDSFALNLDPNSVSGSMEISVEPSLASTIVTSIEQLVDYPYGCTEQTMSRFMPAVATKSLLEDLGAMPMSVRERLPKVTRESLRRLRRFQTSDGGWGWWENDEPDMRMTAVVLEGLYEARKAGVDVDPTMIDRGIAWARAQLITVPDGIHAADQTEDYSRRWQVENVSQLAYAVSLYGPDPSTVNRVHRLLIAKPIMATMTAADLARTALGWKNIARYSEGDAKAEAEAEAYALQAYKALLAKPKSGQIYEDRWWGEDNPRALQAMAEFETDPEKVAEFAMRLLPHRRNGQWDSTRSAAIYALAIKRYLEKTGVTSLTGQIAIKVNGAEVASGSFDAADQSRLTVKLPFDRLAKGENKIEIVSSSGAPVYLARLDQFVGMESIPQEDHATLRIAREYIRMEAKQLEDGSLRLVPQGGTVSDPRSGEVLRCRITIKADAAYDYVMVEDPIPSGFRIVEADEPFTSYGESSWWWDATSFYDDRAVFFKANLPKGESIFEYAVRAEAPGKSRALPTLVSPMYQPEIMASSSSRAVEVRPK